MTSITSSRPIRTRRSPQWVQVATWQVIGQAITFAGFLAAAIVIAVIALVIISRSVTPSYSALQLAQQVAPWFPFAVAIHIAVSWLRPHVAAGMTRRSYVRGAIASALVTGIGAALALVVVLSVEHWVYGRLGWTAGALDGRALAPSTPLLPYLWGLAVLVAAGALSGTIVGLSYVRLGPLATLALPVTLLPLPAVALLGLDPRTMFTAVAIRVDGEIVSPVGFGTGGGLGAVLAALLVLGLAALAVYLLARRIPLPAKVS